MADRPPPTGHLDGQRIAAATLLLAAAYLPLMRHLSPQVSAFVGVILVLRLAAVRWPALTPNRWLLVPLTLAGLGIAFDAYFSLVGRDAGTALLAVMLALKTLELRTPRDLRALAVLFGFLLVSHFLFDQSAWLALYLGALLVADVAIMADITARPEGRPLFSALRLAGTLSLQALPLALVFFLLFPRLSAPLWDLGHQQPRHTTGMSDSMEPGSVAELVVSGEPAFRARFDAAVPPQDRLYWRGLVLWDYDGRRWTRASPGAVPNAQPRLANAAGQIGYDLVLEPTNQRWLYALDLPLAAPDTATLDGDFQITAAQRLTKATRYRMVSATDYNTGPLDLEQEAAGLQLPANVTPRMRNLVAGWQEGGGPRQVIDRALDHIRGTDFYYTLLPPPLGDNPTDQFLFETRRGFCEHYAGAFAVLMRIAGIPARIVLGYQGAERAPWGDWYLVSQAEAHAWVEVWLQGSGWVRVDPTAAIAPQRVERGGFLDRLGAGTPLRFQLDETGVLVRAMHRMRLFAAAAGAAWQDWVLDFSLARQELMLQAVGLGHLREYGLAVAMVVVAAVVLGLLTLALVRGAARRQPLERLYQRFCERFARLGLSRRPGEGPLDYARRVATARPDLSEAIEAFMVPYLPARYRNQVDRTDLKVLKARLRRLRSQRR